MHYIAFHIDGTERTCWAEMLTGTAPDALDLVDGRHHDGLAVMLVFNHLDGTSRAVSSTIAAADTIGEDDTVVFYPNGMTHMDVGLFFLGDGLDGSRGAYLAATGAFWTAIAAFERQGGLHELGEVR